MVVMELAAADAPQDLRRDGSVVELGLRVPGAELVPADRAVTTAVGAVWRNANLKV